MFSRSGLANSKEVSGRIAHLLQLGPILPRICQSIGCRLFPDLDSVGGGEGIGQLGFDLVDKSSEVFVCLDAPSHIHIKAFHSIRALDPPRWVTGEIPASHTSSHRVSDSPDHAYRRYVRVFQSL